MRYSLKSIASILGVFLLLFLLLLGVFAIEKLAYLVDISIRYQVSFTRFVKLYLSIIPDIADYIIPISVLVAVYFVLLQKRESRELLVLSGAGSGVGLIVQILFASGLIAAILSITVSGLIKPLAKFAFRYQYQAAISDLAASGLPGGKYFRQDDKVLFVASSPANRDKKIRVFSFKGKKLEQIFLSDCARLRVIEGAVLSNICKGQAYIFNNSLLNLITGGTTPSRENDCRICADENGQLNVGRLQMANSAFSFDMKSVFEAIKQQRRKELNLFSLLQRQNGNFISNRNAVTAGAMIMLALSSMFAVAIAVVAVALTNSKTKMFSLAVAIGLAMIIVVVAESGVLFISVVAHPVYFAVLAAILLVFSICSILVAGLFFHHKLVVPALVRS